MIEQTRTEQTKQQIVLNAFLLLKKGGLKTLTASKIAQASNMAKSSFFHYFPKIDDFYLYMLDVLVSNYEQQANQKSFSNYQEYIRFSSNFVLDFMEQSPEILTVILAFLDQARNQPETMQRLGKMCKNNVSKWANNLQLLLPSNSNPTKVERLAYLIDIYLLGLNHHYLVNPNRQHYQQITEDLIEMIGLFVEQKQLT